MTDFNAFGAIPTQQPTQNPEGQQPQQGAPMEGTFTGAPSFSAQTPAEQPGMTGGQPMQQPENQLPQFANIIPETPTLSENATEQMMNPAENRSVPQDIVPQQATTSQDIPAGQTTQETQTYFTPTQSAQPAQEPLREYAEPPKGIGGGAMGMISVFCVVVGIVIGALMFSQKTSAPAQQATGLQGVVKNPDITTPLRRCGQVEKGQACIFYIFNNTRYDRAVDSFFDEIVRLTEISKYSIAMVNAQYAKHLIRPGQIAEIKLPAQR